MLDWRMMLGGGVIVAAGAFFAGMNVVSTGMVRDHQRQMAAVITNTWQRETLAVDREINLYNQQISDRRSMAELVDLVERLDTVTGQAREQLRVELKRRDEQIQAAKAEAEARAADLRKYKSQWGDAPVPDDFICRMRGGACETPAGGDRAPAGAGDGVALRN